jgi:lipopolysaccharide export system protein LptC
MTTRAESDERRHARYNGLRLRNRLIGILRIGVPLLGILVFLIFAAQIFLASLGNQFGIGKVSFSGDTVTVDTPTYSGVMANGDVYRISAEAAETTVTDLNVINLKNALLVLTKPDGSTMTARAMAGAFETLGQIMTVPGTAEVIDSTGNSGTLDQIVVDLPKQTLKATGHVVIHLEGGRTVDGDGLDYEAKTDIWTFGKSTMTLPDIAGDAPDKAVQQ